MIMGGGVSCGGNQDKDGLLKFFKESYFEVKEFGKIKNIKPNFIKNTSLEFGEGDKNVYATRKIILSALKYPEVYKGFLVDRVNERLSKIKGSNSMYPVLKSYFEEVLEIENSCFNENTINISFGNIEEAIKKSEKIKKPVLPKTILLTIIKLEQEGRFEIENEIIEPISSFQISINNKSTERKCEMIKINNIPNMNKGVLCFNSERISFGRATLQKELCNIVFEEKEFAETDIYEVICAVYGEEKDKRPSTKEKESKIRLLENVKDSQKESLRQIIIATNRKLKPLGIKIHCGAYKVYWKEL